MNAGKLESLGPIANIVNLLFSFLKRLSPTHYLKKSFPLLRPRAELTQEEIDRPDFSIRRVKAIDSYIGAWLIIEMVLVVFSFNNSGNLYFYFACLLFPTIRIVEIIQVTVNLVLFDSTNGRADGKSASLIRLIVLTFFNFIELIICYGLIYSTNLAELHCAFSPWSGYYVSIMTQLTNGYSDIYPIGWLRAVAAIQGLTSWIFMVIVFGRILSSMRTIKGMSAGDG